MAETLDQSFRRYRENGLNLVGIAGTLSSGVIGGFALLSKGEGNALIFIPGLTFLAPLLAGIYQGYLHYSASRFWAAANLDMVREDQLRGHFIREVGPSGEIQIRSDPGSQTYAATSNRFFGKADEWCIYALRALFASLTFLCLNAAVLRLVGDWLAGGPLQLQLLQWIGVRPQCGLDKSICRRCVRMPIVSFIATPGQLDLTGVTTVCLAWW